MTDIFADAVALHRLGKFAGARRLYKQVLRQQPHYFEALHFLGLVEAQSGHPERAERIIRQALKCNPNAAEAYCNLANVQGELANVQGELGRFEDAIASYNKALQIRPQYANALNGRGAALQAIKRFDDALASYEMALAIEPGFIGAHYNRGNVLLQLGKLADALASFDKVVATEPYHVQAFVDRGKVLNQLGQLENAQESFGTALRLDPHCVDAIYNRGNAFLRIGRLEDALASFNHVLALEPKFPAALNNRGSILVRLGRMDEAQASFDKALEIDPDFLDALSNRGHAAVAVNAYDVAAEDFRKLVDRDPGFPYALGNLLYCRMHLCDWRAFDQLTLQIREGVLAGRRVVSPGQMVAFTDSPKDQFDATRIWVEDVHPKSAVKANTPYRHDKIRLAYVSADFHDHATAILTARLFELHDRTRFEIVAISFSPNDQSAMRIRLMASFDRFIEVGDKTDREVADMMRSMEVDIAVDLMGYARRNRTELFASRPANIQVSYLGYPATMSSTYIDYILADACVLPPADKGNYSEKAVYLPDTYQVNDSTRRISQRPMTRAEVGLPENGFVFCCFNNHWKFTPRVFGVWLRLLSAVEGSVMWLLEPGAIAADNLRRVARGVVAPERLVFARRMGIEEHLARHRLADLFLDTLPYNAHTTTSDALWAGLPVLTCMGHAFPGRVTASLLRSIGLPELIVESLEAYEVTALKLARDQAALSDIRSRLAQNRKTHPLFDTGRFCRHIEAAYITMWGRHQRGELPESFSIDPID
jgi:predicted O-linked N-acetylglucosamine transferase (SPINDLY family)